jgi:hypothetical protein
VVADIAWWVVNLVCLIAAAPAAAEPVKEETKPVVVAEPVKEEVKSVEADKPADDDDDVDLFGSDDEGDDAAKEALRERLLAESEAKKKAKGVIAKSSVVIDVKPFDDETGMLLIVPALMQCAAQLSKPSSHPMLIGSRWADSLVCL